MVPGTTRRPRVAARRAVKRAQMAWRVRRYGVAALPKPTPTLLLAPPDPFLDGEFNATLLLNEAKQRALNVDDLIYFNGKLRPVEEIMMACCAALGFVPSSMLPAPATPSPLAKLDRWARMESSILSPALQVAPDPSGSGFAVMTRRSVREGHALVRIPARLALTADGAVRALPTLLNSQLEAHVSIAAWLMRLLDAPPRELAAYLHSLRTDAEVDCTLMWSDDELKQLQTSLAHSRARKLQGWAEAQWRALFGERPSAWQSLRPPLNATMDRFKWSLCAVWSRSFHLRCAEPSCGKAAGASGGGWRVFAPGADLLNHGGRGVANALLMQEPGGVKPETWRKAVFTRDEEALTPSSEDDSKAVPAAATADDAAVTTPAAAAASDSAAGGGSEDRRRARAKARATRLSDGAAATTKLHPPARRRSATAGGSTSAAAASFNKGALAAGLSDVALGGGGGVWMWREKQTSDHFGGMDVGSQSWMQRVCLHAVCLAEPDADTEAWDAVSAVTTDARGTDTVVLRATRDLERGEEVLLDYGPRSNAELLTTHGFALSDNTHDSVPLELEARDEYSETKQRILTAGNITSPFALSPSALNSDSDLLVALRVIAATPVELQRYGDAFKGQRLSHRNEIKWRKLLKETVEALLSDAEAFTTIAEDEKALEQSASSRRSKGERRKRAALVCRLGEKRLLRAVIEELNASLATLKTESPAAAK